MNHDFWEPDKGRWLSPEDSILWDETPGGNQVAGSVPAVLCRDSKVQHDMVLYSPSGVAKYRSYSNDTGAWGTWTDIPGAGATRFAGDPVTVAVGDDRWDFFGIDAVNNQLQHSKWTTSGGFSKMETVGNQRFQSVPSVVVTDNDRIDVVALGQDDSIKHQALVGTVWNDDWETVGEFGNSAPLVTSFKCNQSTCMGILVVGDGGRLQFSYWATTPSTKWKAVASRWLDLGRNLTTEYMAVG